jgi:DNA-directed RNA polymerase specialized sigma24 family protein
MTTNDMLKAVLEDQAGALIRAEVKALSERQRLVLAARDAVVLHGMSVDEVSAVTGLDPADVRRALTAPMGSRIEPVPDPV